MIGLRHELRKVEGLTVKRTDVTEDQIRIDFEGGATLIVTPKAHCLADRRHDVELRNSDICFIGK